MDEKPLMTGKETAAALGVDPKTLRKMVREGKCPVSPIDTKPHRWRRAEVNAWLRGEAL